MPEFDLSQAVDVHTELHIENVSHTTIRLSNAENTMQVKLDLTAMEDCKYNVPNPITVDQLLACTDGFDFGMTVHTLQRNETSESGLELIRTHYRRDRGQPIVRHDVNATPINL